MAGPTAALARRALRDVSTPERAAGAARFFKTGKGEYGEGDVFIGCTVPDCRRVARAFRDLPLAQIDVLLTSRVHEERLTALFILVHRFERATSEAERKAVFQLYRRRLNRVNNWDLVDASAPAIVGGWLADKPRDWLDELARSRSLWYRRVAMLATFHGIRRGEARDALRIAEALVHDPHDLIHKAVGWMLREVEKRADPAAFGKFLERHAATMPRTMLRYAVERLAPAERERWMSMARPINRRRA